MQNNYDTNRKEIKKDKIIDSIDFEPFLREETLPKIEKNMDLVHVASEFYDLLDDDKENGNYQKMKQRESPKPIKKLSTNIRHLQESISFGDDSPKKKLPGGPTTEIGSTENIPSYRMSATMKNMEQMQIKANQEKFKNNRGVTPLGNIDYFRNYKRQKDSTEQTKEFTIPESLLTQPESKFDFSVYENEVNEILLQTTNNFGADNERNGSPDKAPMKKYNNRNQESPILDLQHIGRDRGQTNDSAEYPVNLQPVY